MNKYYYEKIIPILGLSFSLSLKIDELLFKLTSNNILKFPIFSIYCG